MSDYIQSMMNTAGWEEFKEIFDDKIKELREEKINSSLSGAQYKLIHLANLKAIDTLNKFMNDVKMRGSTIIKEKKNYK